MIFLKYKNIFGLKYYGSIYRMSIKKENLIYDKDARFVYNFKKYGQHVAEIKEAILTLTAHLKIDNIVALPPSLPQLSRLQVLFNSNEIKRVKEAPARKYRHESDIDDEYIETLKIEALPPKILLIDDVATTGKTFEFYNRILKTECVNFAIGINFKLQPEKIEIGEKIKKEKKKEFSLNDYSFMKGEK